MPIKNPQNLLYARAATRARNSAGILTYSSKHAEQLIVKHLQLVLKCEPYSTRVVNTPIEDIELAQKDRRVAMRNIRVMFVNFLARTRIPPENSLLTHECAITQEAVMTFGLRLVCADPRGHQGCLDIMDKAEETLQGLILFPKTSAGPLYFTNDIFEDFDADTNCWVFNQTLEFAYRNQYDVRESKLTGEDCC